jgi:hypothetical protein
MRTPTIALALAALAPLTGCARDEPSGAPLDNPVKAVKEFLIDGTVDANGYKACGFLTTGQQRAAVTLSGGAECRQAFDLAKLRLGSRTVDTVHEVERLSASSSVSGDRASVRLTHAGHSASFELVKATPAETNEFLAPDTEWRIAGGALRLIPHQQL